MLTISCRHCGAEFEKDPKTGNFVCPTEGCGKGGIRGPGGINVETDQEGNVVFTVVEKDDLYDFEG